MEFQEVMRQWQRMCNSVPGKSEYISICSDKESEYICPMKDCGLCNKPLSSQTDDDRIIGERIIMSWAAEHPELVYPTWGEYLASIGVMKPAKPDEAYQVWFKQVYSTNIPADIAQKLGVEPKKG